MKSQFLSFVTVIGLMGLSFSASATEVTVTYSGTITDGFSNQFSFGSPGSLVGYTASITFSYNSPFGVYSSSSSSSSFVFGAGTPTGVEVFITSPGGTGLGGYTVGDTNGSSTDQAAIGSTQQSIFQTVPTPFSEIDQVQATASDPSIPASVFQTFALNNIVLNAAFSFNANYTCSDPPCIQFDTYGDISFGNLVVSNNIPPSPLPTSLPLFATGLGVMGLFGWRRLRTAITLENI